MNKQHITAISIVSAVAGLFLSAAAVSAERERDAPRQAQDARERAAVQDEFARLAADEYFYYCRAGSAIKYRMEIPAGDERPVRLVGARPAPRLGSCAF